MDNGTTSKRDDPDRRLTPEGKESLLRTCNDMSKSLSKVVDAVASLRRAETFRDVNRACDEIELADKMLMRSRIYL
jgi:phosphohistidine phosphatase SixA